MPALLTRMCTPPSSATTFSTAASTLAASETSQPMPRWLVRGWSAPGSADGGLLGGGLVEVEDRDPRALLGEPLGDAEADAPGGAGDHGDTSVETAHADSCVSGAELTGHCRDGPPRRTHIGPRGQVSVGDQAGDQRSSADLVGAGRGRASLTVTVTTSWSSRARRSEAPSMVVVPRRQPSSSPPRPRRHAVSSRRRSDDLGADRARTPARSARPAGTAPGWPVDVDVGEEALVRGPSPSTEVQLDRRGAGCSSCSRAQAQPLRHGPRPSSSGGRCRRRRASPSPSGRRSRSRAPHVLRLPDGAAACEPATSRSPVPSGGGRSRPGVVAGARAPREHQAGGCEQRRPAGFPPMTPWAHATRPGHSPGGSAGRASTDRSRAA